MENALEQRMFTTMEKQGLDIKKRPWLYSFAGA